MLEHGKNQDKVCLRFLLHYVNMYVNSKNEMGKKNPLTSTAIAYNKSNKRCLNLFNKYCSFSKSFKKMFAIYCGFFFFGVETAPISR